MEVFRTEQLETSPETILEAVRDGKEVILSDQKHFDMVIRRKERYDALVFIAEAAANLAQIELARDKEELEPADFGTWTWLRYLDGEDLQEFLAEIRSLVLISGREHRSADLRQALHEWEITAVEALARSEVMEALTAPIDPADYVELPRPGGE